MPSMPYALYNRRSNWAAAAAAMRELEHQAAARQMAESYLAELKRIDPTGWEAWFDAQPEGTMTELGARLRQRIIELEMTACTCTDHAEIGGRGIACATCRGETSEEIPF